jgi:class 3 adenylate cyclase/predicted ATPase
MFVDLVGSTALSARLDPEDMREIIGAYHRCCAEQIIRAGGFVAKFMGDGVLAYFGYPQAHEDDPERAVRSALSLIEAVPQLHAGHDVVLQVRIGIATGVVVVGDLIGEGAAQEQGVVGETPNVAARLQALAEPGQVVISQSTRRLAGGMFEYRDLGRVTLKGLSDVVQAWQVTGASAVQSRFEAYHEASLTPLVGRQEELELLLRRWQRAKSGEGQVALLSGEPGIGKSRLVVALQERLREEPHTRLRYFCSPQHTDRTLHPIIGQIERAAGFALEDDPLAKLDKLDKVFAQTVTPSEERALFAEMLSLTNDGRYPQLEFTPQQRRQRTLDALIAQFETLTRQNPLLMVFEDVHWVDPTSLEVLTRVVDRIQSLRTLLIVTFRPEFDPPWIGQSHVAAVTLNRLTRREVAEMIERVAGGTRLPDGVRQDIVERTDGIPLFAEEMTKAVLEAENVGEARRVAAAVPPGSLAVPASLHASLMARLDRLGPAKRVAQIGAAIGREFSHALLAAAVGAPEAELKSALDRLIAAGLLFRQGLPPHATYLFKHALVQDAAYGTLLREPRRALRARIAEILETQFVEIAESQPELLARHCTEADLIERAAGLWSKAGQRSLERSAFVEAAAQLTRASTQLESLAATPARRQEQIKVQIGLANALLHAKGYAAAETRTSFAQARTLIERAEALGEAPDDPLLFFSVLWGFWVANYVAFDGKALRELAAEFMALAEKQKTTGPLVVGHRIMGTTLLATGEIVAAKAHYDQAVALYDPAEHRQLATRFGFDPGLATLCYRSYALWFLGYPERALKDVGDALVSARESSQGATLLHSLALASLTYLLCRDYRTAGALADEEVALAREKGSLYHEAIGMLHKASVLAATNVPSAATQLFASGAAALQSTGSTLWLPFYLPFVGLAFARSHNFDDAWRCIGQATTMAETSGERRYEPEVQRVAGEIALLMRDFTRAETHFAQALALASDQYANSWKLRAATSMARLWRDQGKRTEARDLLAPIYGWFTEGFDTPDLKEAKALLEELG